jgi:hypothetical protein
MLYIILDGYLLSSYSHLVSQWSARIIWNWFLCLVLFILPGLFFFFLFSWLSISLFRRPTPLNVRLQLFPFSLFLQSYQENT